MTRRRLWASLLGIVIVAVVALATNLVLGNRPILGLDLQGGVSVILAPVEGASSDDLLVIRDLVRDELEQRGIAEPDVRVEGSNLVVDLPGVRDQQEALDAVDVAGIVTLRPVFGCVDASQLESSATSVPGSTPPGSTPPGTGPVPPTTGGPTVSGSSPPSTPSAPPTQNAPSTPAASGGAGESRRLRSTPPTEPPTASPTTVPGGSATTAAPTPTASAPTTTPQGSTPPGSAPPASTTPVAPQQQLQVLSTTEGGICQVGPPGGTGEVFTRNSAVTDIIENGWGVRAELSAEGEVAWNSLAQQCFAGTETCPTRQLAIVLDDIIQSAPTVEAPSFSGEVTISGDFTEDRARSLTRVLNRGAFPVDVQAQSVQTVSPTLGSDSLRAAVIAGLVGLALVLVFLLVFYRSLTVLILAGMTVWGTLIYSVAAFISEATNFALTLAGVTGIIISVGITVDSYVVFFERLKDEARHGRTIRNSAARSFKATWRTIVAADVVSMIGATVLFVLSVGSVRGFALYLGITTACDLIVCWFFTRPAAILLAQSGRLDRRDPFGLRRTDRARAAVGTTT